MTLYARIEDATVRELFTPPDGVAIKDCFVPDIAAQFVPVTGGATPEVGWSFEDGKFSPRDPPAIEQPFPQIISDRQFGEGLWHDGLITYEEYLGFVGPGTIPQPLMKILEDTLPDDDTGQPTPRKVAIGLMTGAKEYQFSNPLVDIMRQAQKWSVDDLKTHWRAWAAL